MLEDEGTVIVGLLVGLNVIDANLCIKGEDLDSQVRDGQRSILYAMALAAAVSVNFSWVEWDGQHLLILFIVYV